VIFPLAFVSNAMVPTQHMPGWQHPVLGAAAWSAFILAVAGPFAAWLFRRRTTE
jgi:hypothetical protein